MTLDAAQIAGMAEKMTPKMREVLAWLEVPELADLPRAALDAIAAREAAEDALREALERIADQRGKCKTCGVWAIGPGGGVTECDCSYSDWTLPEPSEIARAALKETPKLSDTEELANWLDMAGGTDLETVEGVKKLYTISAHLRALSAEVEALRKRLEPEIEKPIEPGSFVGDIFFGHPEKTTMGTHRWNGAEWEELPTELEAALSLLADARKRLAETREAGLREAAEIAGDAGDMFASRGQIEEAFGANEASERILARIDAKPGASHE